MRRLILPILICSLFFSISIDLQAQRKYSNEFLTIGVGARGHGMANAQVAITDDVTAGYWNPAGLTQITAPFQISVMHAEWFAGIAGYDYIGIAKPLNREKKSAIGFSLIRLGIDQIPNTLNLIGPDGAINYNNITEFSAVDYAFLVSYAREISLGKKTLAVGGNTKIIRRVIGKFGNAWGFGIDLGAQYKAGNWRFGALARDITTTFNAWSFDLTEENKEVFLSTGNSIPESSVELTRPRIILAVAYQVAFNNKLSLSAEIDFDFTMDGQRNVLISSSAINIDPHGGIELDYGKFVFLRAGIGNIQKALDDVNGLSSSYSMQPNFGVGLKLGRVKIDYALTNIGNVSQVLYSNIFSLTFDFKGRKKS